MNMLYVVETFRRQGLGAQITAAWEKDMKQAGYSHVMTSTQADEDAQHFYRRLGYVDTGALLFPEQPLEIFFIKKI